MHMCLSKDEKFVVVSATQHYTNMVFVEGVKHYIVRHSIFGPFFTLWIALCIFARLSV